MTADGDALAVAEEVAAELVALGAQAVWLAGSHARGDAGPYSDIDLGAVADRRPEPSPTPTSRRRGYLVNVSWVTPESTRASFRHPATLGAAVPGWRGAVLLRDPDGIGDALRDEARAWRWDAALEAECDRWAAEQVAGYAEEVQKLRNAMARGGGLAAAVQRSVLALRMATVMSVHRRILYDSENALWERVAETMGEPWTGTQAAALGLAGEPFDATCDAALRLYALAAAEVSALLDERQRAVVEPAMALAGGGAAAGSGGALLA